MSLAPDFGAMRHRIRDAVREFVAARAVDDGNADVCDGFIDAWRDRVDAERAADLLRQETALQSRLQKARLALLRAESGLYPAMTVPHSRRTPTEKVMT
jgi:hypothetical protein